jgi:hypothetical protein
MLSFFSSAFAIAGLIAAAGPIIIHLLNRRRHRVVRWAAMDFLREALRKSRRILQLRDLLLLALRAGCLLLVGLALARPHFALSGAAGDPDGPVHAVLVIDNSLSMGYGRLDGTLLDEAKARARSFIDRLPAGSRISVLPLCGSPTEYARDAYRSRQDAVEALGRIAVVDRRGSAARAADLVQEACASAPDLPSKRAVFLGDGQLATWPAGCLGGRGEELPPIQVVGVIPEESENAWVADLRMEDAIADLETRATFVAVIRYIGKEARRGVGVTLSIDGVPVASQPVDLEPDGSREVLFSHRFDLPVESGKVGFATASVSIPEDRLPGDDRRFLVVPVANGIPVVFVDQHGEDEDPKASRYGETYRLRRLIAGGGGGGREAVAVRLRRIDGIDRACLQDARAVVVAGVERPDPATDILRDYVAGGGRLLVACGADFDPRAWSEAGWRDGGGILPAPLDPQPLGSTPEETPGELRPFRLDPATLAAELFAVAGSSREEAADLWSEPLFFKAVRVRLDDPSLEKGAAARPRALASFTNGAPFLVEAAAGRGRILFLASGIHGSWNTLPRTNAAILFDRLIRSMLEGTLPVRNLGTESPFTLPIDPSDRRARFSLARPGGVEEEIPVDALGGDAYGVTVRSIPWRGLYRIAARPDRKEREVAGKLWETALAANGPEEESVLRYLDGTGLRERAGAEGLRWVGKNEEVSLEGAGIAGQDLWRWLLAAALGCLLVEIAVLAWPALRKRSAISDQHTRSH